jgi:hypothetical protein
MVNTVLPRTETAHLHRGDPSFSFGKSGVFSVNQFLSKPFEFSENSRRILFECAQKPKQPLQPCLLACVMRRHDGRRQRMSRVTSGETVQGYGTQVYVLPAASGILAHDRAGAAANRPIAVERADQGCRNRCCGGSGRRRLRHERVLSPPVSERKIAAVHGVPSSPGSQNTLKPADLDPAWQTPPVRIDAVPLPRPRKEPGRKA